MGTLNRTPVKSGDGGGGDNPSSVSSYVICAVAGQHL